MIFTTISYNEFLACTVAGLLYFFGGLNVSFPTLYIYEINSNGTTANNTQENSWIGASGSMFSFIGCLIQGYFADKYGRKIILYVAYSIYFVGWMIISQTIYIIEARLLISFAAGMAFSNSVYIAEIIHPKHRGMFLSLNILFNELGSVTIFFFNYDFSLQTISFVASIFALALLIIIFFIPETPYWYLLKQQREKAIQSLIQLRGLPHNKVEIEISQIEKNFDNFNEVATVFQRTIFNLKWWKYFLVFSLYVILNEFTGNDVISTYTLQIFAKINRTDINNKILIILFSISLLFGSFLSMILIEKFNRKKMAIYYNLINVLFSLIIAFCITYSHSYYLSMVSLIFLFIYGITVLISSWSLTWIIILENLPNEMRATVYAALSAESYILYFLIIKFFPMVMELISINCIILLFALFSTLCIIYIYYRIEDTRGVILPGNKKI